MHRVHVDLDYTWSGNEDPSEIFEVHDILGEGAYGKVYSATHKASNIQLAIKQVLVSGSQKDDLRREIDILKKCKNKNIVQLYGCCIKDNYLWILMEYCGLGSVLDVINTIKKTLTEQQISAVVAYTVLGLIYLHREGIIHRDMKAGNILITDEGFVKIADFGVSSQLGGAASKAKTVVGTPLWMSPEVLEGSKYDGKADIWSLGVSAIEMADGHAPFHDVPIMDAMYKIASGDPPSLQNPSKWSQNFNDFLKCCLVKDPAGRSSAVELLAHPFVQTGLKTGETVIKELISAYREKAPKRNFRQNSSDRDLSSSDQSSDDISPTSTMTNRPSPAMTKRRVKENRKPNSRITVNKGDNPMVAGLKQAVEALKEQLEQAKQQQPLGVKELQSQVEALRTSNAALKEKIAKNSKKMQDETIEDQFLDMSVRELIRQLKSLTERVGKFEADVGKKKKISKSSRKSRKKF